MVPPNCIVPGQFSGIWLLRTAMVSITWIFDRTIEIIFLERLRRDEIKFRADGIAKERGSVLCG